MKNKGNKGFLKELKRPKAEMKPSKPFSYSNPVTTPKQIQTVNFKSKSREPKDKSTLVSEQTAHLEHKGKLNGK